MKALLSRAPIVLFLLFLAFLVVTAVSPLRFESDGAWFGPPCDFSLRMTELDCLKRGVDPFDVWHGDVKLKPFRPNFVEPPGNHADEEVLAGEDYNRQINAYVPWEYTAMLPLSFLPERVAWALYFVFMLGCLVLLFEIGRRFGRSVGTTTAAALGAGTILLAWYPAWSNVCIGNFSVIVVAAVALMAVCLDRGRNALAGVCWAVAMLKPQLGLAFAIPLLMGREFVTCTVAAGICLLASVPPSWMCGASVFKLIAEAPAASTAYFHGCGTMPYGISLMFSENAAILLALAIGAVWCIWATAMVGKERSWIVRLMPAAVCSMSWTYASSYGHFMGWFLFLVLGIEIAKRPRAKFLWLLAALSVLSTTRLWLLFQRVSVAFGGRFAVPEPMNWQVDSINSMIDLVIDSLLCLWLWRHRSEADGRGRKKTIS